MTANESRAMQRAEVQSRASAIAERHGVAATLDAPLAPLVSMRVGGPAAALLRPADTASVAAVVRSLASEGVPHRLLGGGSNLLVADTGLDFVVVHLGASASPAQFDGSRVRVGAGVPVAQVLREATARGLSGLEWAAGLPGSMGGAVVGNAGAFGGEMGRHVRAVTLLRPTGELVQREVSQADFRYRASFVAAGEVLLELELALELGEAPAVRTEADRVNRARAGSQPKGGHSSGCIFRNPEGLSAGRLIDECGLKGRRHGGAFVSPSHANFVINDGTATASDILALIDEVRAEVAARSGVALELEVKVWGATSLGGAP